MINYRILINEKMYFRAIDCAKELGYESEEKFCTQNLGVGIYNSDFGRIVPEEQYNGLCLRKDCKSKIQISRIDILEMKINDYCNIYPLKFMIGKELLQYEAMKAGYNSIEEYVREYDIPRERKKIIDTLKESKEPFKQYNHYLQELDDTSFIKKDVMSENGLELQYITVIKDGLVDLNVYIVGENCFREVIFDSEDIYTKELSS